MRRQAMALWAFGAALVLGAGAAHADEQHKARTSAREPAGQEAATQAKGTKEIGGTKEISGRVVTASPSKLYLEHMGAVVEFNLASDAEFAGGGIRSSSDLSEGQEVRASFTVENKTTNVVKRVSLARESGSAAPHHGGTGSAAEQPATGATSPSERPAPQERAPGMPPGERTPSDPGTPAPRDPGTVPPPMR